MRGNLVQSHANGQETAHRKEHIQAAAESAERALVALRECGQQLRQARETGLSKAADDLQLAVRLLSEAIGKMVD